MRTRRKKYADRNAHRRQLYAKNPEYRETMLKYSRESYKRRGNPKESKLAGGLLRGGVLREVAVPTGRIVTVEAFTMREAAEALGRTLLTVYKWVDEQLIPAPVLYDTTFNHRQYSKGELQVMATILADHERDYSYLWPTHTVVINRLWQEVTVYRMKVNYVDSNA